jgi:hypothetical protein
MPGCTPRVASVRPYRWQGSWHARESECAHTPEDDGDLAVGRADVHSLSRLPVRAELGLR